MDLFYLAIAFAFFILTWGLLRMCEILFNKDSGGHS
jgi:hypothetical protein